MNVIIMLTFFLIGCELSNESEVNAIEQVEQSVDETKNKSIESLDRTLEDMDKMIADMETMNSNLEEIFKAVTDCKTAKECQELSARYAKEFEDRKGE